MKIELNDVYLVQSNDPRRFNPVAIRPRFFFSSDVATPERCEWADTGRGRYLFLASVEPKPSQAWETTPPKSFSLMGEGGDRLEFQRLTKQTYDTSVKDQAVGQLEFPSDEAVREFYLTQKFDPS